MRVCRRFGLLRELYSRTVGLVARAYASNLPKIPVAVEHFLQKGRFQRGQQALADDSTFFRMTNTGAQGGSAKRRFPKCGETGGKKSEDLIVPQ
jgi:hypothetical protein